MKNSKKLLSLIMTIVIFSTSCDLVDVEINNPLAIKIKLEGIAPNRIDPGQQITIKYSIGPKGVNPGEVMSAVLDGLPENSTKNIPIPLNTPDEAGKSSTKITVEQPAADGIYTLTIKLELKDKSVVSAIAGQLTINDMPTKITNLKITPDAHNISNCLGPTLTRTIKYTVTDPNGADDFFNAGIYAIEGGNSELLVSTPIIYTGVLPDKYLITQDFQKDFDVHCEAMPDVYTLTFKGVENDIPNNNDSIMRIEETTKYTVKE